MSIFIFQILCVYLTDNQGKFLKAKPPKTKMCHFKKKKNMNCPVRDA